MTALDIREATPEDAGLIATIYAHHVLHETATFEVDPPSADDWRAKIGLIHRRGWPFVVAESGGSLVGYAYATQFRDRAAYVETCENSIYISSDRLGLGIGGTLLDRLLVTAYTSGFRQMIAVIGGAEPASVALHARHGFVEAGRLLNVGRKFGKLLDTVYMQRELHGG